jgi:hypothetical protein
MGISVWCECGRRFESPEAHAGSLSCCPACGREVYVPKPAPLSDATFDSWESGSARTSGDAIASLVLGVLFFFGCLSGLPAIFLGIRALRETGPTKGRRRGRGMAVAGIVLGVIGCLLTVAFLLPAIRSAGEAARRAQCTGNLKQIAVALQFYHDANDCLPPAAITNKDGRPLLSWRVAVLPYMGSSGLYARFHLDEPWNSPHNFALLGEMPNLYACPSDRALKPGMTGYQAVVGPETAFTPDFKPLTFRDFSDGTATTLVVGESRRSVPWTKPEDLPFDMSVPLSGLGSDHGYHNNGFNAAFADVSVRFLKSSIDPRVLRALLTRNGNDKVFSDDY